MIIKEYEKKDAAITELESLLRSCHDAGKRSQIEREIKFMRAGEKGESEAAYLIDFAYKNSKNTAVIHDLRIEVNGRVAQIDHLLIHRAMIFIALETKNFSSGLKIEKNGDFLRYNSFKKSYEGMPSPISQNDRHIAVLKDAVSKIKMPSGIFSSWSPHFYNRVMVSANARVIREEGFSKGHMVIKSDNLDSSYEKILKEDGNSDASVEALDRVAKEVAALHRPISIDYRAKFGLGANDTDQSPHQQPIGRQETQAVNLSQPSKEYHHKCKKCGGENLYVEFGKFGYYFKCKSCGGNTAIQTDHPVTGKDSKIQKSGSDFYMTSKDGSQKILYFTNK